MSRPFRTDSFPDHPCGYCGSVTWGAVEFFLDNGMPHYKAGCTTCRTTKVAHPDDVSGILPGIEAPDAGMHWPLQKAFAQGRIFMSVEPVHLVEDRRPTCCFDGCTNVGTEAHHFAFVSVFGQTIADQYGTVPLCVKHHTWLHDTFREHVKKGGEL